MSSDIVEMIVRDVAELPDRTSPEDQPDMMLVTAEELASIVREHLRSAPAGRAVEALRDLVRWHDAGGVVENPVLARRLGAAKAALAAPSPAAVGEEVLALAHRLVAAGDLLAKGMVDGPVDTAERHDELQALCEARRIIANPEPDTIRVEPLVVVLARALLALEGK